MSFIGRWLGFSLGLSALTLGMVGAATLAASYGTPGKLVLIGIIIAGFATFGAIVSR